MPDFAEEEKLVQLSGSGGGGKGGGDRKPEEKRTIYLAGLKQMFFLRLPKGLLKVLRKVKNKVSI